MLGAPEVISLNSIFIKSMGKPRWEFIKENKKKKPIKHALDEDIKTLEEKPITIKKKEGRKWKIRIEHLASFFRYIQFGRIDK